LGVELAGATHRMRIRRHGGVLRRRSVYTRGPGRVALHACAEILVILVAMRGNTCVDLRALPSPVEPAIQAAMRIAGPGIGQDIHGRDGAIRAPTLYPAAVLAVVAMFPSTPE
jgi:hypothetical protein